MKQFLFFLFLIGSFQAVQAQTVASDCTAPDSIKMKYMTGADMLALKEIFARDLSYKDSVEIPQFWTDTILRPMLAVYNATALPARDTVVNIYMIRTPYGYAHNFSGCKADTSLFWVQNFKNGIVPCGYEPIDNMMDKYGLSLYHYDGHPMVATGGIMLKSDSNYNVAAMANEFLAIPGVVYSGYPGMFTTNTRDLADTIYSDRIELTYSYHWGDCMSGCYMARYWKFIVYPDCSVEYGGSYGDPLTPTTIASLMPEAAIGIHPNPFSSALNVNNPEKLKGQITLYDVLGRQVLSQPLPTENGEINTATLAPGLYTYRITNGEGLFKTGRLLKQ